MTDDMSCLINLNSLKKIGQKQMDKVIICKLCHTKVKKSEPIIVKFDI